MESNSSVFDSKAGEGFDEHKDKFDDRIKGARYAAVCKRKPFYDEVVAKLDQTRGYIGELFDTIREKESRIV